MWNSDISIDRFLREWEKYIKMTELHEIRRIVDEKIKRGEPIPQIIKRCPKCNNLSLTYDPESGKIKWSKCGFEEALPKIGE